MGRVRIIPILLLDSGGLYKTVRFAKPRYIGDPINTVKIFNEKEADELIVLDFRASYQKRQPDFSKIYDIAGEAFMPMAYGGGIRTLDDAKKVFDSGYEKVVLNTILFRDKTLIRQIANIFGSQSVVASIDVRNNWLGRSRVFGCSGTQEHGMTPIQWASMLEECGAGEIMLNAISKDGTWEGYDLALIQEVSHGIGIPLIACGGASGLGDFRMAVEAGASAVAAGSYFVFQKKGMGVLISFCTGVEIHREDIAQI
ncbi:MAG: imidazole glycerol phosphate synthase subunit HisF [Bacteroidetes bacterium]|nr:imidazole glycerol phosphate synthase subunit HisF [Bacteroidota bacterium]